MNGIFSKEYQLEYSKEKTGTLTNIVHFFPINFHKNKINQKILDILKENYDLIKKGLKGTKNNKLNLIEFSDMIKLLKLNLLSQNIDNYKKFLSSNGGIAINIDLGNKCTFECAHCSIIGNENGKDLSVKELQTYFQNFDNLKNIISKIKFLNGGELLERENFDEIFRYFLEKGINSFSIISRGLNEQNQEYIKKVNLVEKKLKTLKQEFPDFKLEIGISIDKFSKLKDEYIIMNSLFLFNLNLIFDNNTIFISGSNNIHNESETDKLISVFIDIVNEENNLGGFDYFINGDDIIYLKSKKGNLNFNIKNAFIAMDGRGEQNFKQIKEKIPKNKQPIDSFTIQNRENKPFENYGGFSCEPLISPKSLTIKKGGDMKVCISTYLKYLGDFNYQNIKNLDEKEFLNSLARYHTAFYKTLGINKIIKLIKDKRNGQKYNSSCLNNIYLDMNLKDS